MAKKGNKGEKPVRKRFRQNLISSLLIVLILYGGAHWLSRLDGTRTIVADRISTWTRLPVTIERCQLTPLLSLKLEGVAMPGFLMSDVDVRFNLLAGLLDDIPWVEKLSIRGLNVELTRAPESGQWEPMVLNQIGGLVGQAIGISTLQVGAGESRFPQHVLNRNTVVELERAKITWFNEQGIELAYISGLDTSVKVVAFSDRKAVQTILYCGNVKMVSGKLLRDLQIESVKIGGYDPVLILKLSDNAGEYEGFQTKNLWQDLNTHLSALAKIQ